MTAVQTLSEALARGGKVIWDAPGRPRVMVPKPLRERLEAGRDTIREVLRRAAIFREQAAVFIRHGGMLPILALPEHQGFDGCWSCGTQVEAGHYRCPMCAIAVTLALDGRP